MNVDDIPFSEGTPTYLMAGPFRMNRCYYIDNLEALPLLPEKSIDLCLTDPPYDTEFNGIKRGKTKDDPNVYDYTQREGKVYYKDDHQDYWEKMLGWFELVKVSCNWLVFTPGHGHLYDWIIHEKPPYQIRFWYKPNFIGFVRSDPILVYGKSKNVSCLKYVFRHNSMNCNSKGWVATIHPCPKNDYLWDDIIRLSRAESILDPLLGSGTTAQYCEKRGIPWLGFEIMEEYRPDIEKRIALGIKERQKPKQETLF